MAEPGDYPGTRSEGWLSTLWTNTRHSLHLKISLIVVLLVLAIVSLGTALCLRAVGTALFESQLEVSRRWATSLAAGAAAELTAPDAQRAGEHLTHTANALIRWRAAACVAFADADGRVLASAQVRPGLLNWLLPPDGRQLDINRLDTPQLLHQVDTRLAVIQVVVPVYAAPTGHAEPGPSGILGYVLLGNDASVVQARFARIGNHLFLLDLLVLMLVIPGTLIVTRHIVSPLNQLAKAARALANGVMDARAPVTSRNEIGQLARSFNLMASRITQSQMELLQLAAELEQRVEERTRELEDLASKDPLTGLHNRRYFGEVMAREFAAAERYHSDLACLMFDLDHFKQINDRFGHRAGDEVLLTLARSIVSELRSSDVAARFGGDEFIILLPQTSAAAARSLADRIVLTFVRQVTLQLPQVPASLSVGIASLATTRATSAEALINAADRALYAAKSQGRSCMVEAPCATA